MRLIIICMFMLTGCATIAGYQQTLDTWLDKPENELYMAWGAPQGVFPMGDKKMVTYQPQGQTVGVIWGGMLSMSNSTCKTDFVINEFKRVESYRFEGRQCKALKPKQTTASIESGKR